MNFQVLSNEEYNIVWDKFYTEFSFKPSINIWPSIQTNKRQLKLNISKIFGETFSEEKWNRFNELGELVLIEIVEPNGRIYALDWQHECFDFDPRKGLWEKDINSPPLIPDGDYYIFLNKDFSNVWFGHPWEMSVTLIGDKIVRKGIELLEEFKKIEITPFNS